MSKKSLEHEVRALRQKIEQLEAQVPHSNLTFDDAIAASWMDGWETSAKFISEVFEPLIRLRVELESANATLRTHVNDANQANRLHTSQSAVAYMASVMTDLLQRAEPYNRIVGEQPQSVYLDLTPMVQLRDAALDFAAGKPGSEEVLLQVIVQDSPQAAPFIELTKALKLARQSKQTSIYRRIGQRVEQQRLRTGQTIGEAIAQVHLQLKDEGESYPKSTIKDYYYKWHKKSL